MRVLKIKSLRLFVACKDKHDTSSGVQPSSSLVHSLQPALGLSRLNAQILRLISLDNIHFDTVIHRLSGVRPVQCLLAPLSCCSMARLFVEKI